MRESADLRDVHATGGLEPVIVDRDGLVLQQAHELVLLDALLPDPPQDGEPLLQRQRRDASCESVRGGAGGCLGGAGVASMAAAAGGERGRFRRWLETTDRWCQAGCGIQALWALLQIGLGPSKSAPKDSL
jgi:hypothetical protein